ncbi:MAG: sensor histidine kinase [Arcobacteraceae bacterium]|nr:sensor histidine kinase [Arcobacteraceae bacterium]
MKNLENISSSLLIEEIQRRFLEREATIKDMNTMMKKMEEINKKLLKAEENKSKFMSIIKNEFNNPLASMLSLSNSLLSSTQDEKVAFIGQTIQEEALLLNFQINNIIIAAEIESGTLDLQSQNSDFKDMVLQLKEDLKYPIQNKNSQLKLKISTENDFALDTEKVYRILINLVSNSIEFSPKGSIVEVNIFEEIDDFKILVKDYGEGIEDAEKEKIFNRFYQAHSGMNRAHRGQGLGLSVVKDLVNFMDGTIKFDSKVDTYTIFEVTLPKLSKENAIFGDDFMFNNEGINEF